MWYRLIKSKVLLALFGLTLFLVAFWSYFKSPPDYFFSIPLTFTKSNLPCVELEIEGKKHKVLIDLGSKMQLSLRDDVLQQFTKKPDETLSWKDIKGNEYEASAFVIPEIKFGDKIFYNVVTKQESFEYVTKGMVLSADDTENNLDSNKKRLEKWFRKEGTIGRPLLSQINLFMDLGHSIIYGSDCLDNLKNEYNIDHLHSVPFERKFNGAIIFQVQTDIGTLNLGLDTGATMSVFKSSIAQDICCDYERGGMPYFTSSKFVMGGIDFGPMDLYPYALTPLLPIDGILGVDFLVDHIVYLDFNTNIAYISKNDCDCGRQAYFDRMFSEE